MTSKTHIAGGILTGVILTQYMDINIGYSVIAGLGALFPDIDTPTSKIGSKIPGAFLIKFIFGHRGFWHSLLAAFIIYAVLLNLVLPVLAILFVAGYLSHIFLDMFTPKGVPLLWPIQRNFAIPLINTGGVAEYIVMALLIGANFIFIKGLI